jgi:hypothetical protein
MVMAVGELGRGLQAELNRLANGGTYPTPDKFLDAQGAANAWAGSVSKDILGSLNYKASSTRRPDQYKGLNGICNELAGTSSLEAGEALRRIP